MTSIAFGLACVSCLLLSLSLRRHYRQVFPDESRYGARKLWLRWSGHALLALALWPAILAAGPWIGIVLWTSVLALAAVAQVLLLAWRPRSTAAMGALGVVLVVAGLLS